MCDFQTTGEKTPSNHKSKELGQQTIAIHTKCRKEYAHSTGLARHKRKEHAQTLCDGCGNPFAGTKRPVDQDQDHGNGNDDIHGSGAEEV